MADHSNKRKRRIDSDDGLSGKRRATTKQLQYLATYMADHKDFSTGRILATQGKAVNEKLWKELTTVLNDLQGPEKDPYEWKKCWTDLKCNARGRAAKAKAVWAAGRNKSLPPDLSEIDMKVLTVIGIDSCLGLQYQEFGLGNMYQGEQQDTPLQGLISSENSKVSSPLEESRVQLMPSEIKSSDSCSPPLSPQTPNNSILYQIPISISTAPLDPLAASSPPPNDPLASPNPTSQSSLSESEEKPPLPVLTVVPPLAKITSTAASSSRTIPAPSSVPQLSALPPLSAVPPLTPITPSLVPIQPKPSSQQASSNKRRTNSLSNSLSDATDKLQQSQERNTEGLRAIQHAINRLAAASEANNEIQLQFLTEQRKFSSLLEIAIKHWINKER